MSNSSSASQTVEQGDNLDALRAKDESVRAALSGIESDLAGAEAQRAGIVSSLGITDDPDYAINLVGQREELDAKIGQLKARQVALKNASANLGKQISAVIQKRAADELAAESAKATEQLQQRLAALGYHLALARDEAVEVARLHHALRNAADQAANMRRSGIGASVVIPSKISDPAIVVINDVSASWSAAGELVRLIGEIEQGR